MRLNADTARRWAGAGGAAQGPRRHRRARVGGAGAGGGFLKIALEDFIKEFLWVGGGIVNFLSHLGLSGVSLQASFFSF